MTWQIENDDCNWHEGELAAINFPWTHPAIRAWSGRGNGEKMVPHFLRFIVYLLGVGYWDNQSWRWDVTHSGEYWDEGLFQQYFDMQKHFHLNFIVNWLAGGAPGPGVIWVGWCEAPNSLIPAFRIHYKMVVSTSNRELSHFPRNSCKSFPRSPFLLWCTLLLLANLV